MEKILVALVCQEYEIEEFFLFSSSRCDEVLKPLGTLTYLLVTKYHKTVKEVWEFYKTMGYPKGQHTLYGHIIKTRKRIRRNSQLREMHSSLIEGVTIAQNGGILINPDDLHSIMGRIICKVTSLKDAENVANIEKHLDLYIKTEFINKGQYEEEENFKKKAWFAH